MTPNYMCHSYVTVTPNIMWPSYVQSLMRLSYVPETHIMDPSYVEWPLCIYVIVLCAVIEVESTHVLPISRKWSIYKIYYDELKYGHSYVSLPNDRSLILQAPPTPHYIDPLYYVAFIMDHSYVWQDMLSLFFKPNSTEETNTNGYFTMKNF